MRDAVATLTEPVSCDLCGSGGARVVLLSDRLDGPLLRCLECDLRYVARSEASFAFTASSPAKSMHLADRVQALDLARPEVEEAEEPWRRRANRDRLARVRHHRSTGSLLDIGCATGDFLRVAREHFDVAGVEVDPFTSERARRDGLRVHTGTLTDAAIPSGSLDVITLFHVIEHAPSPRKLLSQARELLRPGGLLVLETPTIDTLWFKLKLTRGRWRQLIPDHYFFFSRDTLERLLSSCGYQAVHYAKVGRWISLRFAADRMRRAGMPLAPQLGRAIGKLGLEDVTLYVNPGDIMTLIAIASD